MENLKRERKISKIIAAFCFNVIAFFGLYFFLNESKCFLPSFSDNFVKGFKQKHNAQRFLGEIEIM